MNTCATLDMARYSGANVKPSQCASRRCHAHFTDQPAAHAGAQRTRTAI